jgi:hypothetical protein
VVDDTFSESYPWMRAGPGTFMAWPAAERDRVLTRLPHVATDVVDGWRLFILHAPGEADDPLAIWAVLEETGAVEHVPPRGATLEVEEPGHVTTSELQWSAKRQREVNGPRIYVLEKPGGTPPDQIVVGSAPWTGTRRVTVNVSGAAGQRLAATFTVRQ